MILIDATYINAGGGLVLLQNLLSSLRGRGTFTVLRDIRVTNLDTCGYQVFDIPPRESARRKFYETHQARIQKVLCLGNVPPPRALKVPVITYFHNLVLCTRYPGESWQLRFNCWLKMQYIRWHQDHTQAFWVQSANVVEHLKSQLSPQTKIEIKPFYQKRLATPVCDPGRFQRYGYVSEGHQHKNHEALLQAWKLLAARGLYPELHLTVGERNKHLREQIAQAQAAGLKIINHGHVPAVKIYQSCGYQIYPSLLESFGLGLIEAAEAGCAVLAADLPYVHAVVQPWRTFNPESCVDIALTVEKTLGQTAPASTVLTTNSGEEICTWLATT